MKALRHAKNQAEIGEKGCSMKMTLVVNGVPFTAVGSLHTEVNALKYKWITVTSATYRPECGDYAVELQIEPLARLYEGNYGQVLYRSLGEFLKVLHAIDPNLLPAVEKQVPTPEVAADLKFRSAEKLTEELVSLFDESLGEKLAFDVSSTSGEIIIPAKRKITRTLVRKLVANLESVDLGQTGHVWFADIMHKALRKLRESKSEQPV